MVEFCEGAIADGQFVEAVEMMFEPRLEELVEFTVWDKVMRYEVISVEHLFATLTKNENIESTHIGIRWGLMH